MRCLGWHPRPCLERHVYLASPTPLDVERPVWPGRANSWATDPSPRRSR